MATMVGPRGGATQARDQRPFRILPASPARLLRGGSITRELASSRHEAADCNENPSPTPRKDAGSRHQRSRSPKIWKFSSRIFWEPIFDKMCVVNELLNTSFIQEYKMLVMSCFGEKYAFAILLVCPPLTQQILRHFLNKQTDERFLPRRVCIWQLWDPHHVGWCRCWGGGRGGAGVREGEKAASDSNSPLLALSDSPLRITLGDPRVGEVRGREVRSFLSQIEGSVWSVRSRAQARLV